MNKQDVLDHIATVVARMLDDKGRQPIRVEASSELLGGEVSIDSLDLAMLVRELEEIVGFDPFADGFIEFRTAGELAQLYVKS